MQLNGARNLMEAYGAHGTHNGRPLAVRRARPPAPRNVAAWQAHAQGHRGAGTSGGGGFTASYGGSSGSGGTTASHGAGNGAGASLQAARALEGGSSSSAGSSGTNVQAKTVAGDEARSGSVGSSVVDQLVTQMSMLAHQQQRGQAQAQQQVQQIIQQQLLQVQQAQQAQQDVQGQAQPNPASTQVPPQAGARPATAGSSYTPAAQAPKTVTVTLNSSSSGVGTGPATDGTGQHAAIAAVTVQAQLQQAAQAAATQAAAAQDAAAAPAPYPDATPAVNPSPPATAATGAAAAAAAADGGTPPASPRVRLPLALLPWQAAVLTCHIPNIHAMSGASVASLVTPQTGLVGLELVGTPHEVQVAQEMMESVIHQAAAKEQQA